LWKRRVSVRHIGANVSETQTAPIFRITDDTLDIDALCTRRDASLPAEQLQAPCPTEGGGETTEVCAETGGDILVTSEVRTPSHVKWEADPHITLMSGNTLPITGRSWTQ